MAYDEFKYKLLASLFDMAGQVISSQLSKPMWDEQEKITNDYYEGAKKIVRMPKKDIVKAKESIDGFKVKLIEKAEEEERENEKVPEEREEEEYVPRATTEADLTPQKMAGGTACLPCSRDHLSTVSGALGEAIRFSRREGINHPEVARRIGMSLDELNMLERIDLSPEEMVRLNGSEKQLAEWGLEKARGLRHDITQIRTHEDLERVAAKASEVRTEFMKNLWDVATVDGSIKKLCANLKGDEYSRCVDTIDEVISNKKTRPP